MNKNVVARIIVNTKMLCLIINVSDIRWMEIEIKNHKQGACKIKEIIINSNKQGLIVHIHCLEYILSLKHDKWILFYFEGSSCMIFSFNSIHRMFETIIIQQSILAFAIILATTFLFTLFVFCADWYHVPKTNRFFASLDLIQ